MSSIEIGSKRSRLSSGLAALLIAIAVVIGASSLLRSLAANSDTQQPRQALTVATTIYKLQNSYQREVRYLGIVVAGERAILSFEVNGALDTPPPREGTPVEVGEIIASINTDALELRRQAVEADYKRVKADLALAKLREKRQKKLLASKSISQDIYDETRLTVESLQARVQSVVAALASIKLDIEKSRLIAPYSGVIADRFVSKGTVVSAGTPVVRLITSGIKEAHIGVSTERAQSLVVGNSYKFSRNNQNFSAVLTSIRPDVDPTTRSTIAVFTLPETVNVLDGDTVNLLLSESIELKGGWLPLGALQEGKRGIWTVMRVEPTENSEELLSVREAVQVLDVQAERAYVHGTLRDQSQVVSSGLHRLTSGSRIRLQEK